MSARQHLTGADIDGIIAASTGANARAARLQDQHDRMLAAMKQAAEGIVLGMHVDDQLMVDHSALQAALETAASAALSELQHQADQAAAEASEAVDDAVREAEDAAWIKHIPPRQVALPVLGQAS